MKTLIVFFMMAVGFLAAGNAQENRQVTCEKIVTSPPWANSETFELRTQYVAGEVEEGQDFVYRFTIGNSGTDSVMLLFSQKTISGAPSDRKLAARESRESDPSDHRLHPFKVKFEKKGEKWEVCDRGGLNNFLPLDRFSYTIISEDRETTFMVKIPREIALRGIPYWETREPLNPQDDSSS